MAGSWSDAEAIAAGLYDAPGSAGAKELAAETNKLKTGGSDLFNGGWTAPSSATNTPTTSEKSTSNAGGNSSGQNKFNGWMNYFSGNATGLPSGNGTGEGGSNPSAQDSPAGQTVSSIGATIASYFGRAVIIILGFIFVAAGLAMFGVRTTVGQSVVREVRNSIPK